MDILQHIGSLLHDLHRLEIEVRRFQSVDLLFELQTLSVQSSQLRFALLLSAQRLGRGWSTQRRLSECKCLLLRAYPLYLIQHSPLPSSIPRQSSSVGSLPSSLSSAAVASLTR